MTLKEYAYKRRVKPQAIQRAIRKAQAYSLPCRLLPGVTAITKDGRSYVLTVTGKVTKGRPRIYFKSLKK